MPRPGLAKNLRVGIAGWSYPDWDGVVYPADRKLNKLSFLTRFFKSIEINSTFYRIPNQSTSEKWRQDVRSAADFTFTVKLLRDFTHRPENERLSGSNLKQRAMDFQEALLPLTGDQRVGALLLQFPYSFHYTPKNIRYLKELFGVFDRLPLVVEVRHASFQVPEFFEFLRQHGVGFANIDQPNVSNSLRPTAESTSSIVYLRFHGRNAPAWFDENADRDARYNYDYSETELREWISRVEKLPPGEIVIYAIFNNHFRGQEVANALEFQHLWTRAPVKTPPLLIKRFPRLQQISETDITDIPVDDETLPLFPE